MKYVINIDEDNPIHADDRETVYMDKDTGMTWTISNNGKKKMIPLERIGNDMSDLIDRQSAIEAVSYSDVAYYPGDSPSESDCLRKDSVVKQAIMDVPSAQPEIIYCKDCVKHNRDIGDFEEREDGRHWFWKDEACPLERWRGKAQGHEFDYQFCVYAERRTDEQTSK